VITTLTRLARRTPGKSGIDLSVIGTGLRSAEQVAENVKAGLLVPLSKEEHRQFDAVTPPGGRRTIWPA
jgi:hypothetical protein